MRACARTFGARAVRALLAIALAAPLLGAGSSRLYRNEALRVLSFEPPVGWELAPQASYPRLLASYSHREGGHLTLAAQHVSAAATALSIANAARAPLEHQGFAHLTIAPDGPRARVEATLDGGRRIARQLYIVDGGFAYVLTLIAPAAAAELMTRDFDDAVRSLQLGGAAGDVAR